MRPYVLFGGPSPEHDVSICTGLMAARAMVDAGQDTGAIYWSKAGSFHEVEASLEPVAFAEGVPRGARELQLHVGAGGGFVPVGGGGLGRRRGTLEASAIVNCCHGGPGEDGTIQGLFDLAGLAYTGPSVAGAAFGMD